MRVEQFVDTAKRILDIPTKYQLGGWGQQSNGYYLFDCVCMIKSILWGFNFEKGGHGGAVYGSNGVPDWGANKFFNECCYDISSDFTHIEVGELVWLDGHIGIYVGNLKVVEATCDWDKKVILSSIDYEGRRTYNFTQILTWKYHGKCKFIDYSKEVPRKYEAGTQVIIDGYYHETKDKDSKCLGECTNQIGEIIKVEKYECEYPYEIRNLGWVREKYLSDYVPPKEEKPIEPKKEEPTIWEKIIQAIIDILKAFLDKKE